MIPKKNVKRVESEKTGKAKRAMREVNKQREIERGGRFPFVCHWSVEYLVFSFSHTQHWDGRKTQAMFQIGDRCVL